jgi:hypothetical protein
MRRLLLGAILAAAAVGVAGAFDWPVDKLVLTGTFGESREEHFHAGVDLGGGEQTVRPISPGEVVFYHENGVGLASLPVGLGNFVVLQHQGGIRSIYGHLKDGSLGALAKTVEGGQPLGVTGETGYSAGRHLHLGVIDTEMGTAINPLLVLPPLADTQPPVVRGLYVRAGKEHLRLEKGLTLRRGEVEVLGELYDVRPDVSFLWRMAPYKVFLYQDGREVTSLVFGSLHQLGREGGEEHFPEAAAEVALSGSEKRFADLYEPQGLLRLGYVTLVPGQTTLTVFVADFAGNESSREFLLRVSE